jgi:predicted ATP-dependent endonuclease of OLD family
MILKKIRIQNFRGVNGAVEIDIHLFNCIVGQNDAGKSTILRALDAVLNDKLSKADYNILATDNQISIELYFDCQNKEILLGEEISTTFEKEELINFNRLLVWKKTWEVKDTTLGKSKISLMRKKYDNNYDFLSKTEKDLMKLCTSLGIETSKGNGEAYNNVEKREKLREYNQQNNISFTYDYEEIPSSGTSKLKSIGDAIKNELPSFQYFKADTSLSETDTTIQKYFKDIAVRLIREGANTDDLETTIKEQLGSVLQHITNKINDVVKTSERVEPKIEFDWSKLISTSFVSSSSGMNIPLSSRGDGFRRITMMSYFEYLAETQRASDSQQIIFGFEEPETFLHPSAQDNLFDKLISLVENDYQAVVSTHSPIIVGNTNKNDVTHIIKDSDIYVVKQNDKIDYKSIAKDLGIKPDNTFTPLFSTSCLLFLVEGIDDVNAMHHNATLYKQADLIDNTFEELNINIIPIGGCGGIKHWVNLDLFTKLGKPFFIYLDSDKESATATSPNEQNLLSYGLTTGNNFLVSKKRLLENYIAPTALQRLVPNSTITYSDFDHAKNFCKNYPDSGIRGRLGGAGVAEHHYCKLTFEDLRLTWFDGKTDEFLELYNSITAKLQ